MVIQCPHCQTRFRLADEKIGPNGVSVRCSKCAQTFPVKRESSAPGGSEAEPTRPAPTPPPSPSPFAPPPTNPLASSPPPTPPPTPVAAAAAPPTPPTTPFAAPPSPFGAAPAAFVPPPSPFGGATTAPSSGLSTSRPAPPGFGPSGLPLGIPDPFAEMADGGAPPPGVSFGGPPPGMPDPFANLGFPSSPSAPAAGLPTDDTSAPLGMENSSSEGFNESVRASLLGGAPSVGGEALSEPDPNAGAFDFGNNADFGAAAAEANASATPGLGLDLAGPRGGGAAAPPPWAAQSNESAAPAPGTARARVQEKLAIEREAKKKKADKRPGIRAIRQIKTDAPRDPRPLYRALIALFFAGGAIGAYASLTNGTFTPASIDRARLAVLLGPPPVAEEVAGLALSAREGGFLDTTPGAPRLFVARGVAINGGAAPKGFLQVRGRLRDASGKTLAESTAPCGNAFRDDQLRGFRTREELARAFVPVGDNLSNAKVEPGNAVPCTIVFFDAPPAGAVADVELEIVAAQPVS